MAEKKNLIDEGGLSYLWERIKSKINLIVNNGLNSKVDKVDGMGLSSNDYTTAEKDKLASLENYTLPTATADTLGGVKIGEGLSIIDGVLSASGGGSTITYGTEDLTEGVSPLADGTIYFVYE